MKKMVILMMMLCFVGQIFAQQEGKGFSMEAKIESFRQDVGLTKPQVLIFQNRTGDWAKQELSLLEGGERISRTLIQLSYCAGVVKLFGIIGGGSVGINAVPTFSWSSGVYEIPHLYFDSTQRGQEFSNASHFGLVYGGGAEIALRGKHVGLSLLGRYLSQKVKNPFDLFSYTQTTDSFGSGKEITTTRKAQVRTSTAEETLLRLTIFGNTGRFSAVLGPELLVLNARHSGQGLSETRYAPYWAMSDFRQETDFSFQTQGKNLFGLYARIAYRLKKDYLVFVEGRAGAVRGAGLGVKFEL
jgi:hypothetical protein